MTTETTPNDETAVAAPAVEDTALAVAANEGEPQPGEEKPPVEGEPKPDDKPAEEAPAPEGAPEAYDTAAFQMPEGVEFDAEGFAAVEPVLRDLNLTQDQAGKLMSAYGEKIVPMIQQRTAQQFDEQAAQLRADLARDLQSDPEVGGKLLDESKALAAKAIAHFIPKAAERSEFSTFLNESGMGNNKYLMRIVAGAGRALAEASTPAPETATAPISASELFYGKKKG